MSLAVRSAVVFFQMPFSGVNRPGVGDGHCIILVSTRFVLTGRFIENTCVVTRLYVMPGMFFFPLPHTGSQNEDDLAYEPGGGHRPDAGSRRVHRDGATGDHGRLHARQGDREGVVCFEVRREAQRQISMTRLRRKLPTLSDCILLMLFVFSICEQPKK